MEEQNKHTIEELKDRINIFLNKEFANNRLVDFIGIEFAKKGFSLIIPKLLFENKKATKKATVSTPSPKILYYLLNYFY